MEGQGRRGPLSKGTPGGSPFLPPRFGGRWVKELILALGQTPWPESHVPVCAERTLQKRATEMWTSGSNCVWAFRKGNGIVKSRHGFNHPSVKKTTPSFGLRPGPAGSGTLEMEPGNLFL